MAKNKAKVIIRVDTEPLRRAAVKACRAANKLANKMSVWQPIETAPKCGRTIEVCNAKKKESNKIVSWDAHAEECGTSLCWTTGRMNYDTDDFTHWKELTPQPKPLPIGEKNDT